AAGGAGLVLGAINGALTAGLKLPSVIVTALMGGAIVLLAARAVPARSLDVPEDAFDAWRLPLHAAVEEGTPSEGGATGTLDARPLLITRMMVVLGIYAATMGVLFGHDLTSKSVRPGHPAGL
ncbi:MAG TPA: hypothetical protein DCX07_04080, partial [Phycisphaerales bacterium]|nr:hypothetical protein [Phycisphaerales bacterium]